MAGRTLVKRRITIPARKTLEVGRIKVTIIRDNSNGTVTLDVESPPDQPPKVHSAPRVGRKPLRRLASDR
jgi:hypothetical protein